MVSLQMAKYGMAYHSPKEDLYCFIGKNNKKNTRDLARILQPYESKNQWRKEMELD
jgi:hypothetical protein